MRGAPSVWCCLSRRLAPSQNEIMIEAIFAFAAQRLQRWRGALDQAMLRRSSFCTLPRRLARSRNVTDEATGGRVDRRKLRLKVQLCAVAIETSKQTTDVQLHIEHVRSYCMKERTNERENRAVICSELTNRCCIVLLHPPRPTM